MNKKMIIGIISGIVLIGLVGIISVCFFFKNSTTQYEIIESSDHKFSITIPNTIHYKINTKENNPFSLDLYSVTDEMYLYGSSIEKKRELDFYTVVKADRNAYLADKEQIRNSTDIQETKIKDYTAYEYTLTYYDTSYGKDFYSHIVWIQTKTNLYMLNFEVIAEHADTYQELFLNMKNSFIEL